MKKIEIKGKLNLDKMTIAKLDSTNDVTGGGFLSIGKKCTRWDRCSTKLAVNNA